MNYIQLHATLVDPLALSLLLRNCSRFSGYHQTIHLNIDGSYIAVIQLLLLPYVISRALVLNLKRLNIYIPLESIGIL